MTRTNEQAHALAEAAREDHSSVVELARELVRIPSSGGIDPYGPVLECMASWLAYHQALLALLPLASGPERQGVASRARSGLRSGMRFGIFDHNDASGRPAAQQLAERLELIEAYERLGFHAYHMAEHHGTPLGITPSPHLLLAAASQRTSRIRLGTLITILPLYHPMRVVEEACTLDQLTGGRLDLGVGRGISPIETGFHGVPGDETANRFDEAVEILRLGLTSGTVTYHGKYYQVDEVPVVTRPVQSPHPPLWYGTRTLAKAGWCAQHTMPMMALVPSEKVRPLTDAYRAEWTTLGRAADDMPPLGVTRSVVIAPTAAEAMAIANRAFRRFKDNFEHLWRRYDVPMPPVLPADTFEGIHATGHFYAGDPTGAREWVAHHRDFGGIDYMALEMCFGDMTTDEVLQSAKLFASDVMPAFT